MPKQSDKAELLKKASLIIWDKAPMLHRHALEVVDQLLKDLMNSTLPFGGKLVVLGGNFWQVLPVVCKGTHGQVVQAAISYSPLWKYFQSIKLVTNQRAAEDPEYQKFLLSVGNGEQPTVGDEEVILPSSMCIIRPTYSNALEALIQHVFPNLSSSLDNVDYFAD